VNDQMLNEGFMSERMLQLTAWLEWLQPFLYGLLAIAAVSLVLTLLDLALLCWREFHPAEAQATTTARTKTASVSEVKNVPSAARRLLSHL
jgi:hypothetical protein